MQQSQRKRHRFQHSTLVRQRHSGKFTASECKDHLLHAPPSSSTRLRVRTDTLPLGLCRDDVRRGTCRRTRPTRNRLHRNAHRPSFVPIPAPPPWTRPAAADSSGATTSTRHWKSGQLLRVEDRVARRRLGEGEAAQLGCLLEGLQL